MVILQLSRFRLLLAILILAGQSALALDCSFVFTSPASFFFPSSGGIGSVSVNVGPDLSCTYSVIPSGPAIQSVGFPTASGFNFTAEPNPGPGPASLTGTLTVTTGQASSIVNVTVVSASAVQLRALTTAVDPVANTMDVEYIGGDAHIHQFWYNGAWHAADLSSLTGAPNASASGGLKTIYNSLGNSMEVHYIGADQHVHTLWYNGANWYQADISAMAGAPPAALNSSITASMDPIGNTEDVEYIGTDQHVHELWYTGTWYTTDITVASGAAPNADSSSGINTLMNTIGNAMEVQYIGTDHHTYVLWFPLGGGGAWYAADLTTLAGAPLANSGSPLTSAMDPIGGTEDLEYVRSDQHVEELWYYGGWHPEDLTSLSGAGNLASNGGMHTLHNTIGNSMEVHYVGTDQHVYVLWFPLGGGGAWYSSDLTITTGAPLAVAASPLTSAADTVGNTIDVEYVGTDQHIHQLWYNGSWYTTDLTAVAQ